MRKLVVSAKHTEVRSLPITERHIGTVEGLVFV